MQILLDFFDLSYSFDQFGALSDEDFGRGVQSAYGHNLGYAGYWRVNELRLSHVRNRWFDEDSGSWLSKDPSGHVGSGILYSYVGDQPLKYRDPFGLEETLIDSLLRVIFGAPAITTVDLTHTIKGH